MLNQNGRPNYGPRDWLMAVVKEGWRGKKKRHLRSSPCIHPLRACLFVHGAGLFGSRGIGG